MRSETHQRLQTLFSGVLACTALVAVGLMVTRGFSRESPVADRGGPPSLVDNWDDIVASGRRIGPREAVVTIVEFGDYECPVCASFEQTVLRPFLDDNPGQAAIVVRHWPLSYHRFAYPSARAAECAGSQGKFAEYHRRLYANHDSLGLKSFEKIASEVDGIDPESFAHCIARSEPVDRIEADIEAVQELGGTGTPTVLVNGYRYHRLPTREILDSVLDAARQGD